MTTTTHSLPMKDPFGNPDQALKLSPYLITAFYKKYIVANLCTGEVIVLDKLEYENLLNGTDRDGYFHRNDFLLKALDKHRQQVISRHRTAQQLPAVFNVMILPTLNCDLACTYCFEKGVKQTRMTDDTANAVVKFVEKQINGHLRIDLDWFGGEPLLEIDRVIDLQMKIKAIASKAMCEFRSSITTNGYSLGRREATMLRKVGLKFLQITIDGSSSIHDTNRPSRSGKGTFEEIFNNVLGFLKCVPDGIVTLRVNCSKHSAGSIIPVLLKIPSCFNDRIIIHIHPIMGSRLSCAYSDEFVTAATKVINLAREIGFKTTVDAMIDPKQAVYCYADRSSSVVIDPVGRIFKCAYSNFSANDCIAIIQADGSTLPGPAAETWHDLLKTQPKKCLKCQFLPICGFGCPAQRVSSSENLSCRNRFQFIPDLLVHLSGQENQLKKGIIHETN